MNAERLHARESLLAQLERRPESPSHHDHLQARFDTPVLGDFEDNQAKAFSLVSSAQVQRAFDLSREPSKVRERYGRHTWGQSHLLARRLVEAGVRFVTTVNGPSIIWDTHQGNFKRLKKRLVPPMEQAFAALLDDLTERGLLESTLVVWMGDFGRTPTINKDAGRDHWPQCYSMVLAGGGIRGGQVIGESDAWAPTRNRSRSRLRTFMRRCSPRSATTRTELPICRRKAGRSRSPKASRFATCCSGVPVGGDQLNQK